jgi:hypothetical protein
MVHITAIKCFLTLIQVTGYARLDSAPATPSIGDSYASGFSRGQAEARRDIKEGCMSIYQYGRRDLGDDLDRETGLPIVRIGGCRVDDSVEGRGDGYNQAIMAEIARSGPPSYSFKPWETILFDLPAFFDQRSAARESRRISPDGRAQSLPDGVWSLRLLKSSGLETPNAAGECVLSLIRGPETRAVLTCDASGEIELVSGPKGSRFVVVRSVVISRFYEYVAIDVRRGVRLRSTCVRFGK